MSKLYSVSVPDWVATALTAYAQALQVRQSHLCKAIMCDYLASAVLCGTYRNGLDRLHHAAILYASRKGRTSKAHKALVKKRLDTVYRFLHEGGAPPEIHEGSPLGLAELELIQDSPPTNTAQENEMLESRVLKLESELRKLRERVGILESGPNAEHLIPPDTDDEDGPVGGGWAEEARQQEDTPVPVETPQATPKASTDDDVFADMF